MSGFGKILSNARRFILSAVFCLTIISVFTPSLIYAQGSPCQYNIARLISDIRRSTIPFETVTFIQITSGTAYVMTIDSATIYRLFVDTMVVYSSFTADTGNFEKDLWSGTTVHAHTADFQEVFTSTLAGHSPVYSPLMIIDSATIYQVYLDTVVVRSSFTADTGNFLRNLWVGGKAVITEDLELGATAYAKTFRSLTGDGEFFMNRMYFKTIDDSVTSPYWIFVSSDSKILGTIYTYYNAPVSDSYIMLIQNAWGEVRLGGGADNNSVLVNRDGKGALECPTTVYAPTGNLDEVIWADGSRSTTSFSSMGYGNFSTPADKNLDMAGYDIHGASSMTTTELIASNTVYAHTGNFNEILVSTIIGKSPVNMPSGIRYIDGTVQNSTGSYADNAEFLAVKNSTYSFPVTNILYVDGKRTDIYTENGSIAKPFKKIQDAIDAVTSPSATNKYLIEVSPSAYYSDAITINKEYVTFRSCGLQGARISGKITVENPSSPTPEQITFVGLRISGGLECYASHISINAVDCNITGSSWTFNPATPTDDEYLQVFSGLWNTDIVLTNVYTYLMGGGYYTSFIASGGEFNINNADINTPFQVTLSSIVASAYGDRAGSSVFILNSGTTLYMDADTEGGSTLTVNSGAVLIRTTKAGNIVNIPSGSITSVDVQSAINELSALTDVANSTYTHAQINQILLGDGTVLTTTIVPQGFTSSSTARIPTIFICASDSPSDLKAEAHYVCDGIDDHSEINTAISTASTLGGGIVRLSAGTFNISSPIILMSSVSIAGENKSTKIIDIPTNLNIFNGTNINNVSITGITTDKNEQATHKIFNITGTGNDITIAYNNIMQESYGGGNTGIYIAGNYSNVSIFENYFSRIAMVGGNVIYAGLGEIKNLKIYNNIINAISSGYCVNISALNIQIYGNTIMAGNKGGFQIQSSSQGFISNNIYYAGNANDGFNIDVNCNNLTISNNFSYLSAAYGFNISGSSMIVTGNNAKDNVTANALITLIASKEDLNSWNSDNFKVDGSAPATGNFDMGNNSINSCPEIITATTTIAVIVSTDAKQQNEIYDLQKATTGAQAQIDVIVSTDAQQQNEIYELRNSTFSGKAFTKVVGFTKDCDYVCDGTADDVQIQQAIDDMVTEGRIGTAKLREGTYNITSSILLRTNINLEGTRLQSVLTNDTTQNTILYVATSTLYENCIKEISFIITSASSCIMANSLNAPYASRLEVSDCLFLIKNSSASAIGGYYRYSDFLNNTIKTNLYAGYGFNFCNGVYRCLIANNRFENASTGLMICASPTDPQTYQNCIWSNFFNGCDNGLILDSADVHSTMVHGNIFTVSNTADITDNGDATQMRNNMGSTDLWLDIKEDYAYTQVTTMDAITGIIACDGAGSYSGITDNSTNWDASSDVIASSSPKWSEGYEADQSTHPALWSWKYKIDESTAGLQGQIDVIVSTDAKQQNEIYDLQKATTGAQAQIDVIVSTDAQQQNEIYDLQDSVASVALSTGGLQFAIGIDSVPAVNDFCGFPNFIPNSLNLISLCGFIDTPATGADIIVDCWITNSADIVATINIPIGCSSSTVVNISSQVPSGYWFKARVKQIGSTIAGSDFRINGRYTK